MRVEECEDDLYAAVDLVADKLKRKLVKASAQPALPHACYQPARCKKPRLLQSQLEACLSGQGGL